MGWTNFTPCFRPEVNRLLKKIYAGGSDDEAKVFLNNEKLHVSNSDTNEFCLQNKFSVAERTRSLEIFGLSLSLIALLISLAIFCYFR